MMKTKIKKQTITPARAKEHILEALSKDKQFYTKAWLEAVIACRGNAHFKLASSLSVVVGGDPELWMNPKKCKYRLSTFSDYVKSLNAVLDTVNAPAPGEQHIPHK